MTNSKYILDWWNKKSKIFFLDNIEKYYLQSEYNSLEGKYKYYVRQFTQTLILVQTIEMVYKILEVFFPDEIHSS